ncbi:uncharacterized protein LOC108154552 [Drosophila miranda]|uniref:uncharacterized protein LOC108154552 n=1 Tax=Drosophila miranda TaxID=7229 RepID=UPI0007E813B8|nr:uncharacterized protein LOC108154552 [Drosophila miranda]
MMSSKSGQMGSNDCNLHTTDSDCALQLKPAPKLVCIPQQLHRHRLFTSDISINQRPREYDVLDKSWSVLYFGAPKDKNSK